MVKKILMVFPSQGGTIAKCSYNLYKALIDEPNVEVKIVALHRDKDENKIIECECFDDAPKSAKKNIFTIQKKIRWLKSIKKSYRPDITISTLTGCSVYNVLSKGTDLKIGIFHSPTYQLKTHPINYYMAEFCFRRIFTKLDKIYCVSDEISNYIKNRYPWINSDKIETVYNIHPIDNIRQMGLEEISDAFERNLFEANNVYLFCGRLDLNKSPERLIKGFALSELKDTDAKLVFIGQEWDYKEDDIMEISQRYGIKSQVFYIGIKSNPYKYMYRSKSLISVSKSEGLPGVLIESLILGKPVIATNSSLGIWEILSNENNYKKDFDSVAILSDGIITSNLSNEEINEGNIAKALNIMSKTNFPVDFNFKGKISSELIIKKYLI